MQNITFDKTIVLTLPRRSDRLRGFYEQVDSVKDWPFDRPEVFWGSDGSKFQTPHFCGENMLPGSWGSTVAWAHIMEQALTHDYQQILVFEDDSCFCEDFGPKVRELIAAVPDDWDTIYFGGCLRSPRQKSPMVVNDLVMRPYRMTATQCIAMRPNFMREAYKRIYTIPIGIANQRMSDVMCGMKRTLDGWEIEWPRPSVNCYAAIDRLVGQRAGPSDITGNRLENADHPLGWHFWPNPTTIEYIPDFKHPPAPGTCKWLPQPEEAAA